MDFGPQIVVEGGIMDRTDRVCLWCAGLATVGACMCAPVKKVSAQDFKPGKVANGLAQINFVNSSATSVPVMVAFNRPGDQIALTPIGIHYEDRTNPVLDPFFRPGFFKK